MRLIDFIKGIFRPAPPRPAAADPALRNKPGGMAWIKSSPGLWGGAEVLAGRAVKTVALTPLGLWGIDPPQTYVATRAHQLRNGVTIFQGQTAVITGMGDTTLEPWKEDGVTDAEVRKIYEPSIALRVFWASDL